MTRMEGAQKLHLWSWLRGKHICEDDRDAELKRRWDETMSRFLQQRAA